MNGCSTASTLWTPDVVPVVENDLMRCSPFINNATVVILDWDDTLLPSSWITQAGHRLDTPLEIDETTRQQLETLEQSVANLLHCVTQRSTCVIITNAETGWVELSAAKFMPSVAKVVNRLRVVSARSSYERTYPDSPLDWKFAAFTQELDSFYNGFAADARRNVISFGDSLHEREAIHLVTGAMQNVHTKSIKFVERPSIRQLQHQVDMVLGYFNHIFHYNDSLDLMLSVS